MADPQKRPSKLVREGESQAHLHLGPASPTCALGQGVCQLDHSVMAWRTRYRQNLWPGLLAPFIKAAGQLQNRGLHRGARPGAGFSETTASPSLHTYCVPGSLKLLSTISHLLLTAATRDGGLYYPRSPKNIKDLVSYSLVAAASIEAKADPRVWAWSPASPTSQKAHCLR